MQKISAERYVELVNQRMRKHSQYVPGMAVRLDLSAIGEPLGIVPISAGADILTVVASAEFDVTQQYEVEPPFVDWRTSERRPG